MILGAGGGLEGELVAGGFARSTTTPCEAADADAAAPLDDACFPVQLMHGANDAMIQIPIRFDCMAPYSVIRCSAGRRSS